MTKELQIYELVLMLKNSLDTETNEKIEFYRDFLTAKGSQVMVKNNGKKSLAYPIQGSETATFIQYVYCGNGDLNKELNVEIQRDESVLRAITTKLRQQDLVEPFAIAN